MLQIEYINYIIKPFINLGKLEYIINCMILCVIRLHNTIEIFAKQEQNNHYNAIAKLEFKEKQTKNLNMIHCCINFSYQNVKLF